jgi:DNA end-binding protein Ku
MFFETPYYLVPAKGGEKVYALLREALRATHKVAVATFVMRGRQHLCVVTPLEGRLMLLTLRFESEVLPPSAAAEAAGIKHAGVKPAELTMAKQLVEQMSGPWNPTTFKDTYRADLMRRIQEKIRRKQIHSLAPEGEVPDDRPKAQVIDLMEALKRSLKRRPSSKPSEPSARRIAKPRRRERA